MAGTKNGSLGLLEKKKQAGWASKLQEGSWGDPCMGRGGQAACTLGIRRPVAVFLHTAHAEKSRWGRVHVQMQPQ